MQNGILICIIAITGLSLFNRYDAAYSAKAGAVFFVSSAYAADGQSEKYPYGGSKGGIYGEKRTVSSKAEAAKILREYFSGKDLTIGEIREKDLYYEAELLDKKGVIVDTVIVDKRTGRIRSIY